MENSSHRAKKNIYRRQATPIFLAQHVTLRLHVYVANTDDHSYPFLQNFFSLEKINSYNDKQRLERNIFFLVHEMNHTVFCLFGPQNYRLSYLRTLRTLQTHDRTAQCFTVSMQTACKHNNYFQQAEYHSRASSNNYFIIHSKYFELFTSLPPRRLFSVFLPISQHYFSIKTSSNVFTVILYFLTCVQLVFGQHVNATSLTEFIIAQVALFPGKYTTELMPDIWVCTLSTPHCKRFNLKEFSSVEVSI